MHEQTATRPGRRLLGVFIDATTYATATEAVIRWARAGNARAVFAANVHMVMEAVDSPDFASVLERADLVTADGMPLVWSQRAMGIPRSERVYGPELTLRICAAAAAEGLPIGVYGGAEDVLNAFCNSLKKRFPNLQIAYAHSPPFRTLSAAEKVAVARDINDSGATLLLVGLGCPKQERWIDEHREVLNMPMVGVGAAFDFIAGRKRQAPSLMQRAGMEWLFRLATEPSRLWRRYLYHNPRFVYRLARQLHAQSK